MITFLINSGEIKIERFSLPASPSASVRPGQRNKRQNNFTDYLFLYRSSWKPYSVKSNYMSLVQTESLDTVRVRIAL